MSRLRRTVPDSWPSCHVQLSQVSNLFHGDSGMGSRKLSLGGWATRVGVLDRRTHGLTPPMAAPATLFSCPPRNPLIRNDPQRTPLWTCGTQDPRMVGKCVSDKRVPTRKRVATRFRVATHSWVKGSVLDGTGLGGSWKSFPLAVVLKGHGSSWTQPSRGRPSGKRLLGNDMTQVNHVKLGERRATPKVAADICPDCSGLNLHKRSCPKFHALERGLRRVGPKGSLPALKGVR